MKKNDKKKSAKPADKKKKSTGSKILDKYNRMRKLFKFYSLKKEIGLNFTSGDESKLERYKKKMEKSRKLAAPELIKRQRAKKAARGRGKKRGGVGGDLSKLSSK